MRLILSIAVVVASAAMAMGQVPAAAAAQGTWKPLSDGRSFVGWEQTTPGWRIESGAFVCAAKHSLLRTAGKYLNFELELEWRMKAGANGGVFFGMADDMQLVGPQLQLCDAKVAGITQTGGLFGILSPERDASKPLGSWNTARLVVKGKLREHWINNIKVLAYETDSDTYKSAISSAKVRDWPGLAEHLRGAIALECHRFTDKESGEVAYRNIRVRELPDIP